MVPIAAAQKRPKFPGSLATREGFQKLLRKLQFHHRLGVALGGAVSGL